MKEYRGTPLPRGKVSRRRHDRDGCFRLLYAEDPIKILTFGDLLGEIVTFGLCFAVNRLFLDWPCLWRHS